MSPIVKNIIGIVLGLVVGGIVNMALIMISGSVIPPPIEVDPANMESLKNSMHLFEPKHFIFPFLAHAIGTFVGVLIGYGISATNKLYLALIIGAVFLMGGIINTFLLPAPLWFICLDLVLAYLPMAWVGYKLSNKSK